MASTRSPLAVIGSYLPQSGFTRVLLTVLSRLSAGYDVHFVGMGYKGPPIVRGRMTIHPTNLQAGDAFIVLNANRPIARKRIDLTIAAFAHFARNLPPDANVWLYLHHAIITAAERDHVLAWAREHGVLDRLILDTTPASDAQLNLIYNACDVGLNTAMGEGWGLVSLEHAATGAAQIVPRHSACGEIWADGGVLVDPVSSGVPVFSPLDMATVSPIDVARALERLYADDAYRQDMSAAALRIARRSDYSWDAIADRWAALLQQTIASAGRGEAA